MATQPGLAPGSAPPRERMPSVSNESTLGALGRAPSNAPLANTLGGLGSRGRTKTGPGLGPDAGRAVSGPTLVSASEDALRAREAMNDALGLPLVGAQSPVKPALDAGQIAQKYGNLPLVSAKGPATREESVAFSLGDGDFEELESAPIQPGLHGAAALGAPAPQPVQLDDEDALPLPEVPEVPEVPEEDEEITRVGVPRDAVPRQEAPRAAPAAQAASRAAPAPAAPAARPLNPFAGATLLGGSTQQTPHTQAPQTPLLQAPTPPAPLPAPAPPIPPGYATQQLAAAFAPPRTAPMQQAAPAPAPFGMLETPGLPPPAFGGFEPVPAQRSAPPPPLLIDVTPLTLAVETVNGFCDAIIERNTQVPCERTRVFVTAADNQTFVRVRISQGESSRFGENTLLGEVELGGLHPARRGEVQIALSFSLDTNGMLNVSAKEVATGRATSVLVRLIALPDASDIAWMTQRNAARQI
jgi:hypothetical protein